MKITRITISNFLKLKDVDFNPSHTNIIVGRNKMGKTSILKAIRAAFDGKVDESSIRIGEGKAEITLELDALNIKRTLTSKGSYLDISNKEGMKMPAPQRYLDGLIGSFSFNPVAFFDLKSSERKKYLLNAIKLTITQDELATYTGEKLAGLDYEAHALEVVEQARKWYYDKRTGANSEVTKLEKSLQSLTESIPEGFDPKSVSEEQITKMREAIQTDKMTKQKHADHLKHIATLQSQEKDLLEQIVSLQDKLANTQNAIATAVGATFDYSDDMVLASAEEALAKLEGQREVAFTVKRAEEVRGELTGAMATADKLDGVVKKLTKEVPEDLIAKAKLPVEGLTIAGDDILIGGVNLDNLSSSEQLKFGLQVVRALNGDFRVVCIDGIESLDGDTFTAFLKEIEGDDYQYFVTRVDGNSPHSIVVEDGEIKK